MESNIEVALAVKLQKLFPPNAERFLAFPMGCGFTYEDLDFVGDEAACSAEQLRRRQFSAFEFAVRLNRIPEDALVFSVVGERLLWDEYKQALETAQYAGSTLTEGETQQLDEARDYLGCGISASAGAGERLSMPYEKYIQYKRAAEIAERQYRNEQLTVEVSTDEALRAQWLTAREQELRAVLEQAKRDWGMLGYKDAVEERLAVVARLSARTPDRYAREYLDLLAGCLAPEAVGAPTDSYVTLYSPSDCFDNGNAWTRVSMTSEEMDVLTRSAPPELAGFLSSREDGIESISLEYSRVSIVRPWHNPDVYASRYWRMAERDYVISDGGQPRRGRVPAYITHMIAARNIEVTRRRAEVSKESGLRLGFVAPNLSLRQRAVADGRSQTPAPFKSGSLASLSISARPGPRPMPEAHGTSVKPPTSLGGEIVAGLALLAARYIGSIVRSLAVPTPPAPTPREMAGDMVHESLDLDGVAVIAFECRRVPKCPDPDETLVWPA
jgi:hypothetical protein